MELFKKFKDRITQANQLTAENCRSKQHKSKHRDFNERLRGKIYEIDQRITHVVQNSDTESTVIYSCSSLDDLYPSIKEYYSNLGYELIEIQVPELGNKPYIIISWEVIS